MNELLLPFQLDFMRDAFVIAGLIAVPCALLSCFLVLKGWSLMGDAVSHAVLPGVVLAYILNIPLLIGAFVAGMSCALATGFLTDHSRIKQDTVMGVVFSGMFGIGLVLYTWIESEVHLDHILFGNMLGIDATDLWTAGIVGGLVSLALMARWRDLMLHAFDPGQARALGMPVGLFHYGLLGLLSLTIVSTLSAVGIILAIGLLIAPGAIAFLVTRRFGAMLMVAVAVTLVASWGGVYASFWIDSAPAPTIILGLTLIFIMAFVWKSITIRRAENGRASQTG
ncbi:metal ABC transporter permease [Limimaricola hongkongensis]|uniref:Manganese ABC transporter, inner membrane permease protein SitD n=1 Tax=Limimaricola hongkongensis DSM 17492 TaxID=1122180 RepID=A0A017HD68_9RHOB|nr:metal ABC transporter permease [Limimaricola hongkongensis]EYD72260.1 Manganese ABC transporter, inner membrane permease protein SitD [Limimaricola hongkongensis DSM 17492]